MRPNQVPSQPEFHAIPVHLLWRRLPWRSTYIEANASRGSDGARHKRTLAAAGNAPGSGVAVRVDACGLLGEWAQPTLGSLAPACCLRDGAVREEAAGQGGAAGAAVGAGSNRRHRQEPQAGGRAGAVRARQPEPAAHRQGRQGHAGGREGGCGGSGQGWRAADPGAAVCEVGDRDRAGGAPGPCTGHRLLDGPPGCRWRRLPVELPARARGGSRRHLCRPAGQAQVCRADTGGRVRQDRRRGLHGCGEPRGRQSRHPRNLSALAQRRARAHAPGSARRSRPRRPKARRSMRCSCRADRRTWSWSRACSRKPRSTRQRSS